MPIPLWDYRKEYEEEREDLLAGVDKVLRSGQLILGSSVRAFEEAFARHCGTAHGVGVNSGTDALFLALRALGIGPRDEVITVFGGRKNLSETEIARLANSRSGGNYVYYHGGVLRFGKLTMTNSDLKIFDANPKDPFDFSIDHYNQQLVAGYSKSTPKYGLVAHVPDYYKIRKASAIQLSRRMNPKPSVESNRSSPTGQKRPQKH